jgi:undecaprenyl-diphosphatase
MTDTRRAALLVLAFVLLEAALIFFVDRPLSEFLRGVAAAHPAFINVFHAYTDFGKSKWYLWPSGIALIACAIALRLPKASASQRQRLGRAAHNLAFFFGSIALSGLITDAIKPILGRARPVELLRDSAYGFQPWTFHAAWNGMPSGHATTAAALAAALVALFPRYNIIWILLGIALAASRVMVNAHYLSDVLAGSAVGILTTLWLASRRDHQGMFPVINGIFPIDKPSTKR